MSRLFPELTKGGSDGSVQRVAAAPQGNGAVATPEAIARFAVMLGAPGRVRSAAVLPSGDVRIEIDLGKAGIARIALVEDVERAWLRGDGFGITHEGPSVHPALKQILQRFVKGAPASPMASFRALCKPEAEDEHQIGWDDPSSLVYSYGAARSWRSFFEERELYRGVCEAFQGNVVVVTHNELECQYNAVARAPGVVSFFNTVVSGARPKGGQGRALITDLQDLDVIKGGDAKLDAALATIAESGERPDMVVVKSTCVPIVTGDDMDAAAGRAKRKLGLPVIVAGNHNSPLEATLEQAFQAERAAPVARRPGTVNIVGMPHIVGQEGLFQALERGGVSVNAAVFPDLDVPSVARFGAAELTVVYDWERHATGAEMLARRFDVPVLRPPQPFGLDGSRRWLFAIAEAMGRLPQMREAWDEMVAPYAPTWARLAAEARSYRLGFVLDDERWEEALAARRCMGVPLLDVVTEMGFGVDVFIYGPRALAASAPSAREGVDVRVYKTRPELEACLREARAAAFYSEMYFDRRLTRTGKNAFSLKDFQLGPAGALATLKRLLAVCRLPYFRSYAKHLGRPFSPTGAS